MVALLIAGIDLNVIALIGIILVDRYRQEENAIMMIDFALDAQRSEGLKTCAGHLPGGIVAFSTNYDDDHWLRFWAVCAGVWAVVLDPSCVKPLGFTDYRWVDCQSDDYPLHTPVITCGLRSCDAGAEASSVETALGWRRHRETTCMPRNKQCGAFLGAVHTATGGNHAVNHCGNLGWPAGLQLMPVAPLPQVEFPTIQ